MTPAQADQRIVHSRTVLAGLAGALEALELAGPPGEYQRMITAEIVVLRGLALEHAAKADKIGYLIERYEALSRHIGLLAH